MRSLPRATVAQLKEALCYVSLHYTTDRVQATRHRAGFESVWTAPDGSELRLADERFRCGEVCELNE